MVRASGLTLEFDYGVWRWHFGLNVTPFTNGDGTGNGIVETNDLRLLGTTTLERTVPGTSVRWASTSPCRWSTLAIRRRWRTSRSAAPIRRTRLLIRAHDGSGEQLRTVPVGNADTLSITFSEGVNLVASDLTLVGLRTANRPMLADFSYDTGTMTATWRFESWNEADHYVISLSDAVSDVEGIPLDGEWVNPASLFTTNAAVSEFPSGNGQAGGDFNFVVTILPGDASLNNIFNWADIEIFEESWMSQLEDALFTDGDASGDGYVNSADWYFMASLGLNLQTVWSGRSQWRLFGGRAGCRNRGGQSRHGESYPDRRRPGR